MHQERDYASCARALGEKIAALTSREERMRLTVEVLWAHLQDKRVAWLGFYELTPGGDSMLLRVCRPKPACSPIGMHGACGQVFLSAKPLVVRDVKDLGPNYVACDPLLGADGLGRIGLLRDLSRTAAYIGSAPKWCITGRSRRRLRAASA